MTEAKPQAVKDAYRIGGSKEGEAALQSLTPKYDGVRIYVEKGEFPEDGWLVGADDYDDDGDVESEFEDYYDHNGEPFRPMTKSEAKALAYDIAYWLVRQNRCAEAKVEGPGISKVFKARYYLKVMG